MSEYKIWFSLKPSFILTFQWMIFLNYLPYYASRKADYCCQLIILKRRLIEFRWKKFLFSFRINTIFLIIANMAQI